jgi:lipopolysaccharide/colanic/teichoic acid biosynthesis glycosyltransferase
MHKETQWRLFIAALVLSDLACVCGGALLAGFVRSLPAFGAHASEPLGTLIPMLPLVTLIFLTQGLYAPENLLGGTREYGAVFRACAYSLVGFVLLGFAVHRQVSREWLGLSWIFATALVGSARFVLRRIAYRLRRRGYFTRRALVVGADADSVAVAAQLRVLGSGVEVVGFLDDYAPAGSPVLDGLKILGTPAALLPVAERLKAKEAIVVPQALPWETLHSLMTEAATASNGLRVHVSAGFYNLLTTGVRLSEQNHVPLLTVNRARLTLFESLFKGILDYVLAAAFVVVFAPAMLRTALRLRRDGGRIIERRWVVGKGAKAFEQLSFRPSPTIGSEFVRKLPGLVNVFRAELSLVGPRPVSQREVAASGSTRMLTVRPGLTGPWRQADDPAEQAVLDLYYIRSYTVWLDLQVLFGRLKFHLRRRRAPRPALPALTRARP